MRLWLGALVGLASAGVFGATIAACSSPLGATCGVDFNCGDDAASDGTATDGVANSDGAGDANGDQSIGDGSNTDGGSDGPSDALIDNWDGFDGFVCNPTWAPSDNNCVVDDSFGVFVSGSSGNDANGGTKASPLQTVQAGVAKAKMSGKRLYVCAGTYAENVVVNATNDGVKVYGGLDCSAWTYSATANKVKVAPPSGYALNVDALTTGVSIEDFEFDSADAMAAGGSSIAVMVNGSQNVALKRVTVKAGNAHAGADGSTIANYSGANATSGGTGTVSTGGAGPLCSCLDGTTSSHGGNGAAPAGIPTDGSAVPTVGTSNGGNSGSVTCTDGTVGASGGPGQGGVGSTSSGSLSMTGWSIGAAGGDGATGKPAQGGGGGGSKNVFGGGGGGCGGCGGGRGTGGATGGSSFGLASVSSAISLDTCSITAGNGGGGGHGADAQGGQGAGALGAGACNGGPGGLGGTGGGGGGGAGGLSVAIAYKTTAPTETGTVNKTVGAPGGAGAAGNPGSATAGIAGVAQQTMSF